MVTAFSPPLPTDEIRPPASYWQSLGLVAAWAALLLAVVLGLHRAFPAQWHLTEAGFSNWDVEHYQYIREHGYDLVRTAFFPLFPFLWRGLGVSAIGMALVNLLLFAVSFAALAWQLRWSWRTQLLVLSVPSLMFMALPYSEAVFFASGALVLLGLHRQQPGLYALGLLLSCTSRSAAFVLLPAVVATLVLAPAARRPRAEAALAAAATLLGLGTSVLIHYAYTGRWFVFFAAQRLWDNRLRWPALPLSNWAGAFPTRFEAPPLLLGLGCVGALGWLAWNRRQHQLPVPSRPLVFGLAYLGGITLVTLATKGGVLVSLSRYVYATPYFLVLLAYLHQHIRLSNRQLLAAFGLMELTWLALFGAYTHIRSVLGFSLVSLVVMLWLLNLHQQPRVRRLVLLPTVLVGTGLLLYLLKRFLAHEWVA